MFPRCVSCPSPTRSTSLMFPHIRHFLSSCFHVIFHVAIYASCDLPGLICGRAQLVRIEVPLESTLLCCCFNGVELDFILKTEPFLFIIPLSVTSVVVSINCTLLMLPSPFKCLDRYQKVWSNFKPLPAAVECSESQLIKFFKCFTSW